MEDGYLFKAKRIDNGEWVVGFYAYIHKKHYIYTGQLIHSGLYDVAERFEVDPSTICRCTGLKDKNGKLIWKNDIVAYWDTYSTESGCAEADCIGRVVWDAETISFQVTNRLSAESYEVLGECSVIGNIFDNPELLEV